jgi:hypothetical protein
MARRALLPLPYVGDEVRYQVYVRLGLERERETAAEEREAAELFTSARDWGFGW